MTTYLPIYLYFIGKLFKNYPQSKNEIIILKSHLRELRNVDHNIFNEFYKEEK